MFLSRHKRNVQLIDTVKLRLDGRERDQVRGGGLPGVFLVPSLTSIKFL